MAKKGVLLLGKPNSQGDELIQFQVEILKYITNKEMKLIEELASLNKVKATSTAAAVDKLVQARKFYLQTISNCICLNSQFNQYKMYA